MESGKLEKRLHGGNGIWPNPSKEAQLGAQHLEGIHTAKGELGRIQSPLRTRMTLGKSLTLSGPPFLHLEDRDNDVHLAIRR